MNAALAEPGYDSGVGLTPHAALDPDPVVEAYKKDVDQSLLRRNLGLTVEQRFLQLSELQRVAAELRDAGRKARLATLSQVEMLLRQRSGE
jgi:hypothetical protein